MDPNKIYENMDFSIRQVSKATGVKESTLRYWEKTFGEVLSPDRTDGNQRAYSTNDVEKVLEIKREAYAAQQELLDEQHANEMAAIQEYVGYTEQAMTYISSIAGSIHQVTMNNIDAETRKKKEHARATIKNEKALSKELAKIDKEAEKKRQEAAEREKAIALVMAIVNTAVAVTKTLASYSYPVNIILAALTAAAGAAEIAVIASQSFAKGGVVQGSGGTDSEVVNATPGEAILTQQQQRRFLDIAEGRRGGASPTITMGGDTIIIQGNADEAAIAAIQQTRQDQLESLREQLIELDALNQMPV